MARSTRSQESAGRSEVPATPADVAAPVPTAELPPAMLGWSRAAIDICQQWVSWSQQVAAAQARTLEGVGAALDSTLAGVGAARAWGDLAESTTTLWKSSLEQMQRSQGDLPYAFMSLQFDVWRSLLAGLSAGVGAQGAPGHVHGVDPAHMMEQARDSLDPWMRRWVGLWTLVHPVQVC